MGRKVVRHKLKHRRSARARTRQEQRARERALHALNDMRRTGMSLRVAASIHGTSPETVRKYVGGALKRDGTGRRYRATASDRLTRRLEFLTPEGKIAVSVRGSRDASRVAHHHNAVKQYLDTGNAEGLQAFQNQTLLIGKRRLPFLTDLGVLESVVQAEPSFDNLYVRAAG